MALFSRISERGVAGLRRSVSTVLLVAGVVTAGAGSAVAAPVGSTTTTIEIVQGNNQSVTARSSFPNPLTVLVHDQDPEAPGPVAGAVVTFTVSAGSAVLGTGQSSVQVTTGTDGLAEYPLTAGPTAGPVTVRVTSSVTGATTALFTETVLPAPVLAVSELSGDGQSASLRNDFAAPLLVGVWDEFGEPAVGGTVTFTIVALTGGGAASFPGGAQTARATVDSQGHAAAPPLTAGTIPGPLEVVASYDAASAPAMFEGLNVVYPQPASITPTGGDAQSAIAGTAFADVLTVRVLDNHGFPLTGPPPTVTFTVASGSATFPGGAGSAQSQATIDGYAASPTLTAGGRAGSVTVTAEVSGSSTLLSTSFAATVEPSVAAQITAVSGAGQAVLASNAQSPSYFGPLVVRVVDQLDRPLPMVDVEFTVSGPASFAGSPTTTGQTGPDGTTTVTSLLAGQSGGTVTVTAAVGGLDTTAQLTETVLPRVPTLVVAQSGGSQTAATGTRFAQPLIALVLDQTNTILSGVPVTFTVTGPASFDGATTTSVVSGNDGTASAPALVAGSTIGAVSVTASVSGATAAVFSGTVTAADLLGDGATPPPADGGAVPPGTDAPAAPAPGGFRPSPTIDAADAGADTATPVAAGAAIPPARAVRAVTAVPQAPAVPSARAMRVLADTGVPVDHLAVGAVVLLLAGFALVARSAARPSDRRR
jgi:adhesin/invasin